MAVATNSGSNYLRRAPSPSGLADVLNVILDKGIVIDAFVRISVIGIELVTIDARIVIASVDTYLRFAEAVNRLDLAETQLQGMPELQEVGAKVSPSTRSTRSRKRSRRRRPRAGRRERRRGRRGSRGRGRGREASRRPQEDDDDEDEE